MEGTGIHGPRRTVITRSGGKKFAFRKEGVTKFVRFIKGVKAQKIEPSVDHVIEDAGNAIIEDVIVHLNG